MKKTPQQLQGPPDELSSAGVRLHRPVLLQATLDVLKPKKGDSYLDLTAGYGGHAGAIIAKIGDAHLATLVDRDQNAISSLQPFAKGGARVIKNDYATEAAALHKAGELFDVILLDIGVSSPQLDNPQRGFSFMQDGPLDMRMDQSAGKSAADLVNRLSKDDLVYILRTYGEEPHATKIATAITHNRPFSTTTQLAQVIEQAFRGRRGKIHPATRTFQALRIAVNDELKQLSDTLLLLPDLLKPDGRVAIISFHSLEDRLVKHFFKEQASAGYEATLTLLTKQPISGATEDVSNPRARSAKLRAAAKINTKRGYHAY